LLVLVAALTWIGRSGYRDVDGSSITLLDALYYASVSITTTGYGDITPVSDGARAVTALVVTPARVLFLIVLVGTTIELLTERFRAARRESRWRNDVHNHVIIVGFGTKGRGALETLLAGGHTTSDQVIAIDTSPEAVAEAGAAGVPAILGDGTRTAVLRQARVDSARAVIVTCHRDDTATLVTLTARELNPRAVITAGVREAENAHLLRQSGASTVIVSSEASGRMLGLATAAPGAVGVLEDLLVLGSGMDLSERAADGSEVGGPPRSTFDTIPIALVRDGSTYSFREPQFQHVTAGDVVICVRAPSTDN
jgi:voltage-gated potassium channel